MWTRIKQLLAPPVFEGDEEKTRVARLLNPLLWILLGVCVISGLATIFVFTYKLGSAITVGMLSLVVVGAMWAMYQGRVKFASRFFVWGIWIPSAAVVVLSHTRSLAAASFVSLSVGAGLLLGPQDAVLIAVISDLTILAVLIADKLGYAVPLLFPLSLAANWVMLTISLVTAIAPLHLALRRLGKALDVARVSTTELEEQREQLEDIVEERTRDLAQRTRYLEATTEVARDAALALDVEELLSHVVTSIKELFGFYRMGIFLLDPTGEWVELRAASGQAVGATLARGFRLRVGKEGIVGHVAKTGEARVVQDVRVDPLFVSDSDAAETRSEAAMPLRARGKIIGVLDVQSAELEAFSDEDVAVLQTLADQVAVAISNAQLFRQSEERLQAERRAYAKLSRRAWRELLQARPDLGFVKEGGVISTVEGAWQPEMERALRSGEVVPGDDGTTNVAVPIKVRDQVIGVIDAHKPENSDTWQSEQIDLLQTLADQLGVALESARLYEDTQRRAARERLISEVTGEIRQSLDMDTVLRTAVQDIREAMGLPMVTIQLTTQSEETADADRVEAS